MPTDADFIQSVTRSGLCFFFLSWFLTLTESGDRRSSSDAVDDETGDERDDFVGRPIRFFDVEPLLLFWCADCDKLVEEVCVDGMAVFIVIAGIL